MNQRLFGMGRRTHVFFRSNANADLALQLFRVRERDAR